MTTKKLWLSLALVMASSFAVLLFFGNDIYRKAPPIPAKVISETGEVLFTGQDIKDGQNVWQSIGGQTVGSIWGHGAYIAPDWTADYLHRESLAMLTALAEKDGKAYNSLSSEEQLVYKERMKHDLRTNTFKSTDNTITYSASRAKVFHEMAGYYTKLFMSDPSFSLLRSQYAIKEGTIQDPERMRLMAASLHGVPGCVSLKDLMARASHLPTTGPMMNW
ncbi:hypothetical protein [Chitinophaga sp. CF418]|uniref:hypothetical protein n=1 Tax=Chitinophaga sp. CF418 TaxID=1855287 RepID=UPI0009169955|nr:hypothetical protein [Chitinophaga sp. CF418]SHN11118.1 nitric oxide reductase subunit B [Chitinophaga sp. CF418]